MNNFIERMLTIIFGSTLGIFMLTYNTYTMILFFIIGVVFIYGELIYALHQGNKLNNKDLILLTILTALFYANRYANRYANDTVYIIYLLLLLLNVSTKPLKLLMFLIAGILWIWPSVYLCIKYAVFDVRLFICLAGITWTTDGGAYIWGKLFGRTKLAPYISPNKTVEGTFLGILSSVFIAYFVSYYYTFILWGDLLILSIIYGVFGQIGDLVESRFKRWVGIKDAGKILPGMGGVNDRCDSIYLAIPIGHIYILLRGYVI